MEGSIDTRRVPEQGRSLLFSNFMGIGISTKTLTIIYVSGSLHIDGGKCKNVMEISKVAEICKALSDENRIRIIEMLTQGEKCGCDLLEQLHITQPTLSHHMKILENTGLISSYKEGKWMHYSINCEMFQTFRSYISGISCCDSVKGECRTQNCCCKENQ